MGKSSSHKVKHGGTGAGPPPEPQPGEFTGVLDVDASARERVLLTISD